MKVKKGFELIKKLTVYGYRGFGEEQTIDFASPNGKEGSGITFIVGANNSGKTTILESVRAFNGDQTESPNFSIGKRNTKSNGVIKMQLEEEDGSIHKIETVSPGGSTTIKQSSKAFSFYILQSRRSFDYEFDQGSAERETFVKIYLKLGAGRVPQLPVFYLRLFLILKNKQKFDDLLREILGHDIEWTIDQNDNGRYFIKYSFNGLIHSSEGVGDGIWSMFTICDALYDSEINSTVIIDEPELSLHPHIQRRLMEVLIRFSTNRQVVICTHSPYFVNWDAIANGANLIRTTKDSDGNIKCFCLNEECRCAFQGIISDLNNPHILGINANEVFFLPDRIILVEGQEDVVIFKRILKSLGKSLSAEFFGWGAGGADKIKTFLHLFYVLGYQNVTAIFDGDKREQLEKAKEKYPSYNYVLLCTDDIRDKEGNTNKPKIGITDSKGSLKPEFVEYTSCLIDEISTFMG